MKMSSQVSYAQQATGFSLVEGAWVVIRLWTQGILTRETAVESMAYPQGCLSAVHGMSSSSKCQHPVELAMWGLLQLHLIPAKQNRSARDRIDERRAALREPALPLGQWSLAQAPLARQMW